LDKNLVSAFFFYDVIDGCLSLVFYFFLFYLYDNQVNKYKQLIKLSIISGVSSEFFFGKSAAHAFEAELKRRKFAMFFYLLRSPIFDR
jgi:hypothetical protein